METNEDDRYSYSTTALARLVFSEELRDLADHAGSLVPTVSDASWHPGEIVDAARRLVEQAQDVLTRAVIYERERSSSWDRIGENLGDISRQSAHARYSDDVTEWKEALHEPFYEQDGPLRNLRLPHAAFRPTETGRRLDAWVLERGLEGDAHTVTGGLPELSITAELTQVLDALAHLYRNPFDRVDDTKRARLLDRKAALLDRIATEQNRPEAAQQAAEARALAAELRADKDGRHLRAVTDE
ncbi:hypothetical protein [Nocardia alba]|uniref:Uncharacterized protein n=1 Tax=Nocardia alba TaxID=225051 RepID=A0A4R1FBI2_9NOCA|nr:hypothetical protein [Nocardia alba]TCJ88101.1 hypothetical protein DFR71_6643 [Nocardia alba]